MSVHTPGPWIVDPYTQAIEQAAIEICQIDGEAISLCVVSTNKFRATKETMEANARLIAASPELLEALEAAQKALAMMVDPTAIRSTSPVFAFANCTEAERMSRAAISKATKAKGEQP